MLQCEDPSKIKYEKYKTMPFLVDDWGMPRQSVFISKSLPYVRSPKETMQVSTKLTSTKFTQTCKSGQWKKFEFTHLSITSTSWCFHLSHDYGECCLCMALFKLHYECDVMNFPHYWWNDKSITLCLKATKSGYIKIKNEWSKNKILYKESSMIWDWILGL